MDFVSPIDAFVPLRKLSVCLWILRHVSQRIDWLVRHPEGARSESFLVLLPPVTILPLSKTSKACQISHDDYCIIFITEMGRATLPLSVHFPVDPSLLDSWFTLSKLRKTERHIGSSIILSIRPCPPLILLHSARAFCAGCVRKPGCRDNDVSIIRPMRI